LTGWPICCADGLRAVRAGGAVDAGALLQQQYGAAWREAGGGCTTWKGSNNRPGHGDYVEGIGVQDVERGGLSAIKPAPWQTDTAIGDWFYNTTWKAKDPDNVTGQRSG
jgi:hypothetical protein